MVKLVSLYPPCRGFHQEFWVVIFIGEEGIEGQADIRTLGCDFLVTGFNNFCAQGISHPL